MQTLFDRLQVAGTNIYDSSRELTSINNDAFQRLAEQNVKTLETYVATATKQFGLLQDANDYQSVVAQQAELGTAYGSALLDSVQQTASIYSDTREQLTDWIGRRVNEVSPIAQPQKKDNKKAA